MFCCLFSSLEEALLPTILTRLFPFFYYQVWQKLFFDGRLVATDNVNPDFVALAQVQPILIYNRFDYTTYSKKNPILYALAQVQPILLYNPDLVALA